MIANALTKHDPNDQCLWDLLFYGTWHIGGEVRIRYTARVTDFTEDDLYDMNRTKPHPFAKLPDGEMLCLLCDSEAPHSNGIRVAQSTQVSEEC